jgi:phosphatidylinositol 4-kinase
VAESATQTQQGLDHDLSSPRQRQGTYTATISIVAELCDAAQGIKEIPSLVDRQAALRGKLALLNQRIANLPAHASVLFPMGRRTARFVRVPPDECALLNSRDKSPFMVCIEVINDNDDADGGGSEFEEWH